MLIALAAAALPAQSQYAIGNGAYYTYASPTPSPTPPSYDSVVLADNPLVYLKMSDASPGPFIDSSGNNNTITNTAPISYHQTALTSELAPYSAAFNSAGYATDSATWSTNTVAAECWVNINSTDLATNISLLGNYWGPITSSGGFDLTVESGQPKFYYGTRTLNFGSTISAGVHHLVAEWDGTYATTYLDGAQSSQNSIAPVGNIYTANPASPYTYWGAIYTSGGIGYQSSSKISNCALYVTPLSATRVLTHYDLGTGQPAPTPSPSPLANFVAPSTGTYAGQPIQDAICINDGTNASTGLTYLNILPVIPAGYGAASGQPMGEFAASGYTKGLLDATWGQYTMRRGSVGGQRTQIATLASALTIPTDGSSFTVQASMANPSGVVVADITQNITSVGSQTVTVTNTTNMAVGQTLGIGGTTPEYVYIKAVGTGTITAFFGLTHNSGTPIGTVVAVGRPLITGLTDTTGNDNIVVEGILVSAATTTWSLADAYVMQTFMPGLSATTIPTTSTAGYGTTQIYAMTFLAWNGYITGFGAQNPGYAQDSWWGYAGDGTNGGIVPQAIDNDGSGNQTLDLTAQPFNNADEWPNETTALYNGQGSYQQLQFATNTTAGSGTWPTAGSSVTLNVTAGTGSTTTLDVPVFVGLPGSGQIGTGFVGSRTANTITLYDVQYPEGSAGGTIGTGIVVNYVDYKPFDVGNVDYDASCEYCYIAAQELVPYGEGLEPAFWSLMTQSGYGLNSSTLGGLHRNEVDIQERFGNSLADNTMNAGDLSWGSFAGYGTPGFWSGTPGIPSNGGAFIVTTPDTTYHSYGATWNPGGGPQPWPTPNPSTGYYDWTASTLYGTYAPNTPPCNNLVTAGVSEVLDGTPNAGEIGCGDPTVNLPTLTNGGNFEKEVMASWQMDNKGTAVAPATASTFTIPSALYGSVNVTVSTTTGWVQQTGREYVISDGTHTMNGMLVGVSGTTLTFLRMASSPSTSGTMASGATITAQDNNFVATYPIHYRFKYIRIYKRTTASCT